MLPLMTRFPGLMNPNLRNFNNIHDERAYKKEMNRCVWINLKENGTLR